MSFFTTTDLRTKSSQLVKALKNGTTISLIHRSKIVGKIEPVLEPEPIIFNAQEFQEFLKTLGLIKKLSLKERERRYRQYLQQKYGQNLS